ncbi:LysR family transcriptional regulator [Amycolatopsis rubida]|uniref:DNA-binding transcriptional regulator, LysR family n=1 Tax=Amycolatopsis rubida TaxID=112413 RepID=A0A1I5YWV0_9PSEU|nr:MULTISPECIES: LysR family transcriptional regulator [Amycolatopsis]MYW96321.1 LysR family transcriptional regulator [Amycolatopsis rubida]NEC61311.1 LysR family transcriptional regulator [Amycolatopsis rubida]OAP24154.1 HTH-type transcriptional regulator BenM [Amycolatopsis sp. M39]SFQ48741.1 DNA-binding transcriptional regulator, LysR family [Amycolatopsis rubida]
MELRQLRYFVAVAEERSFRRAAERLHLAQPALSQQIAKLEKELSVRLLLRTTRSVELTEPGRVLLTEGRRVLADSQHALTAVAHAARGELGLLRIGFVSSAALEIVPATVLEMRRQWPNVRFELTESTTDAQIAALGDGQLDVGIAREVGDAAGLTVHPLGRERLIVAVSETHPLADKETVEMAELADEPFLAFPRTRVSRLHDHIETLCLRAGFRIRVVQEAVQFPTMLGLVAADTGIAIVPNALRALQLPGLRYLALADAGAFSTVSAISRTDHENNPVVDRFLSVARAG